MTASNMDYRTGFAINITKQKTEPDTGLQNLLHWITKSHEGAARTTMTIRVLEL